MTMLALIVTLTLSILVAPCASDAQQTANVYRIGILAGSAPDLRVQRGHETLQQSWRALGYPVQAPAQKVYRRRRNCVLHLSAMDEFATDEEATTYRMLKQVLQNHVALEEMS